MNGPCMIKFSFVDFQSIYILLVHSAYLFYMFYFTYSLTTLPNTGQEKDGVLPKRHESSLTWFLLLS